MPVSRKVLLERLQGQPAAREHYRRLLELLKEHAYRPGEVKLASGKISDFYIDCRRVALSAEGHLHVGYLIGWVLTHHWPDVRAVGGLTMGADPLASATATLSALSPHPLDAFYVRKEPKAHGTGKWIESGELPPSCPVAILEDVVTSGGSALEAVRHAKEHGLEPRLVCALVDRLEGGAETISAELPLLALYTREDFQC